MQAQIAVTVIGRHTRYVPGHGEGTTHIRGPGNGVSIGPLALDDRELCAAERT